MILLMICIKINDFDGIAAYVALFTLPKVYEMNKTEIDAHLDVVCSKINEITEK